MGEKIEPVNIAKPQLLRGFANRCIWYDSIWAMSNTAQPRADDEVDFFLYADDAYREKPHNPSIPRYKTWTRRWQGVKAKLVKTISIYAKAMQVMYYGIGRC